MPIIPVVKVTGDPGLKSELEYFDIYAGTIIEGAEEKDEVGERLMTEIREVAAGKLTKQEYSRYREVLDMYAMGPSA